MQTHNGHQIIIWTHHFWFLTISPRSVLKNDHPSSLYGGVRVGFVLNEEP
ncbi:hypothetical protein YC2023_098883 [Brassica napus]